MEYEEILKDFLTLGHINGMVECRSDYCYDEIVGVRCYYEYAQLAHKYDIELEQNIPDDKYSNSEIWDMVEELAYKLEKKIHHELYKYVIDVEDTTNIDFVKYDNGNTAFNVFNLGQNIAHDMWADGFFDEDNIIVNESDMLDWVLDKFKPLIEEVMNELKYQLQFNPDINRGNIYVEDIIE